MPAYDLYRSINAKNPNGEATGWPCLCSVTGAATVMDALRAGAPAAREFRYVRHDGDRAVYVDEHGTHTAIAEDPPGSPSRFVETAA